MRQTQTEDMLRDHEERIRKIEEFLGVFSPIDTKKGQEQRDKIREEMLKKAEEETIEVDNQEVIDGKAVDMAEELRKSVSDVKITQTEPIKVESPREEPKEDKKSIKSQEEVKDDKSDMAYTR